MEEILCLFQPHVCFQWVTFSLSKMHKQLTKPLKKVDLIVRNVLSALGFTVNASVQDASEKNQEQNLKDRCPHVREADKPTHGPRAMANTVGGPALPTDPA